MAKIFNEWNRRYSEAPESFGECLDENGKPIDDYGKRAAIYFHQIADELDAKNLLPKGE